MTNPIDPKVNTHPTQAPVKRNRSFWLKVLVFTFAFASIFGWLRLYQAIFDWQFLIDLQVRPAPIYFAIHGLTAGMLTLLTAITLWFGVKWAPWLGRGAAIFLAIWYWLDRILLSKSLTSRTDMPFAAIVTILLLVFVFIILALPTQQRFFHRQ
jgi:riboflavin transporter FmnP